MTRFLSIKHAAIIVGLAILLCPTAAMANVLHDTATDCINCHVSAMPTESDAALRACSRPRPAVDANQQAPDFFVIGEISEIYVPVVFPHKLHASMMNMAGDCSVCHHRNPEGPILNCKECHGGPSNPESLSRPSLKGAYHRQCLGCHREWSHQTDCVICHAKRDPAIEYSAPTDLSDIMGSLHPNVEVPAKKIYEAKTLDSAPIVTFHHEDHAERFGLSCASCHQKENCSNCHDIDAKVDRVRTDPHEDCQACHALEIENDCAYCHDTQERPRFDHAERAGFALKAYHLEATCRECHPEDRPKAETPQDCRECHAPDWFPESFDHALTGIPLDETHAMVSCDGCHTEGLGSATKCDACHDDGRTTFARE